MMKKVLKNYKSMIILIGAIIIGAIVGIIWGEDASVLSPLGDLFLNLLLVSIVPLIFLNITTSIGKMKEPKRLGKIMKSIVGIFLITSFIAVMVGFVSTYFVDLVNVSDVDAIKEIIDVDAKSDDTELALLDRTVQLVSVNDFSGLLSRDNMMALLVASILVGIAIRRSREKGEKFLDVLVSANDVVLEFINLIMYYAPIGLGCYFAALVGTLGASIAVGYLKTFVLYLVISVAFYFIVYSIYAYIAGGKKGFKVFWKNIIPVTITSLATCSSAACIPVNVDTAKKIGVSNDIAETIVPMGTSFHKDGSIIGSVFKIMFLVCLFGTDITSFDGITQVLLVALLANLLVTAVPIGGGTISEALIISMLGFPMGALPILTIIATIIDAPATMLNVVGDTSSAMLCARVVDGKDWLDKKQIKKKGSK